jgi:hypothetical protein
LAAAPRWSPIRRCLNRRPVIRCATSIIPATSRWAGCPELSAPPTASRRVRAAFPATPSRHGRGWETPSRPASAYSFAEPKGTGSVRPAAASLNSKSEARKPKKFRNTKTRNAKQSLVELWISIAHFGFVSDFGFRICFGFRISGFSVGPRTKEGFRNATKTSGPTVGPFRLGRAGLGTGVQRRPSPGMCHLRDALLQRRAMPGIPLPPLVSPLPGAAADHLHQVRLSTPGVQSVWAAEFRLLPNLLDAVAAATQLGALSDNAARRLCAARRPIGVSRRPEHGTVRAYANTARRHRPAAGRGRTAQCAAATVPAGGARAIPDAAADGTRPDARQTGAVSWSMGVTRPCSPRKPGHRSKRKPKRRCSPHSKRCGDTWSAARIAALVFFFGTLEPAARFLPTAPRRLGLAFVAPSNRLSNGKENLFLTECRGPVPKKLSDELLRGSRFWDARQRVSRRDEPPPGVASRRFFCLLPPGIQEYRNH